MGMQINATHMPKGRLRYGFSPRAYSRLLLRGLSSASGCGSTKLCGRVGSWLFVLNWKHLGHESKELTIKMSEAE